MPTLQRMTKKSEGWWGLVLAVYSSAGPWGGGPGSATEAPLQRLCHGRLIHFFFSVLPISRPYSPWNLALVKKLLVNENHSFATNKRVSQALYFQTLERFSYDLEKRFR